MDEYVRCLYVHLCQLDCPYIKELSESVAGKIFFTEKNFTRFLIIQWLFNEILSLSSCPKSFADTEGHVIKELVSLSISLGILNKECAEDILVGKGTRDEQFAFWNILVVTVDSLKSSVSNSMSGSGECNDSSVTGHNHQTETSTNSTSSSLSPVIYENLKQRLSICQQYLSNILATNEMENFLHNSTKLSTSQIRLTSSDVSEINKQMNNVLIEIKRLASVTMAKVKNKQTGGEFEYWWMEENVCRLIKELGQQLYTFDMAYTLYLQDVCSNKTSANNEKRSDNGLGEKYAAISEKLRMLHTHMDSLEHVSTVVGALNK